jgi:hypothetical protein
LEKIKELKDSAAVSVIYAAEETAGAGGEPAEWFLLTNGAADSFEAAYEKARWHTRRWKIERLQERAIDKTTVLALSREQNGQDAGTAVYDRRGGKLS